MTVLYALNYVHYKFSITLFLITVYLRYTNVFDIFNSALHSYSDNVWVTTYIKQIKLCYSHNHILGYAIYTKKTLVINIYI